jgi:acetyltransferase-like isoleucine patch superfamily enzyme
MDWSVKISGYGNINVIGRVGIDRNTKLQLGHDGTLALDDGSWIGSNCDISVGKNISIGRFSSIQNNSQLLGDVDIGSGCLFGANLYVSSSWHHYLDDPALTIREQDDRARLMDYKERSRPVRVGDDCWFGVNVVLAPGVVVHRGAVIGANSVVKSDVPPYTVVAGAPARPIKKRLDFDPPALIQSNCKDHIPYFYSGFRSANDRQKFLYIASNDFEIALAVLPKGGRIELQLNSEVTGYLSYGPTKYKVPLGISEMNFSTQRSNQYGIMKFSWAPDPAQGANKVLILLSAEIISHD